MKIHHMPAGHPPLPEGACFAGRHSSSPQLQEIAMLPLAPPMPRRLYLQQTKVLAGNRDLVIDVRNLPVM
jgi:hypothetical protein